MRLMRGGPAGPFGIACQTSGKPSTQFDHSCATESVSYERGTFPSREATDLGLSNRLRSLGPRLEAIKQIAAGTSKEGSTECALSRDASFIALLSAPSAGLVRRLTPFSGLPEAVFIRRPRTCSSAHPAWCHGLSARTRPSRPFRD